MEKLAAWVWGTPTMILLLMAGVMMTVVTRGIQLRKLGSALRQAVGAVEGGGRSSFRALCTALAATVGTGNIAGVAGAITLGGPGAVFWMWVSAFLGMATKYAEVVLAMRYRVRNPQGEWLGGPMYYICHGMGERWKPLAAVFALCTVLASFGMGNMAQVHTMSAAVQTAIPQIRPERAALGTGLAAALIVGLVTLGGVRRIGAVMEKLVPVMAGLYVLGTLSIIVVHRQQLWAALEAILCGAFCPEAVIGGGAGIGIRQAVRWGIARGVFSNEAGLGSAPIAHAAAEAQPEEQGLFGIFEVFLDTVVLCTLTALAILVSGIPLPYGRPAGAELAAAALETVFGNWSAGLLAACLGLLALATLISWQLYGVRCAGYLWGSTGETVYRICYVIVILMGATMELSAVWALSDLFNGLMCLPNLAALLALRRDVRRFTNYPGKRGDLLLDFRQTALHNDK